MEPSCDPCLVQDGGWFEGVVTDYSALDKTHWCATQQLPLEISLVFLTMHLAILVLFCFLTFLPFASHHAVVARILRCSRQ